jgi:small multidrug resistance pump
MSVAALLLAVAIVIEVASTAALPRTAGFSDPMWSAVVLGGYAVSILLLARIVAQIPVSVTYAIWSGAGTALVAVVGVTVLGERLDALKTVALGCIVFGVVLLNVRGAH